MESLEKDNTAPAITNKSRPQTGGYSWNFTVIAANASAKMWTQSA